MQNTEHSRLTDHVEAVRVDTEPAFPLAAAAAVAAAAAPRRRKRRRPRLVSTPTALSATLQLLERHTKPLLLLLLLIPRRAPSTAYRCGAVSVL